jgi:hypothetical protein
MNRKSQARLLEEAVSLLVTHYGSKKVRAAVAKVAPEGDAKQETQRRTRPIEKTSTRPCIRSGLEDLKNIDPERYRLLDEFLTSVRDRRILPDSEDLRQFAQFAGLKELKGRSRRDMIPKVVVFLMELPNEKLADALKHAERISEATRRNAYSVLTDKLLRDT